MALTAMPQRQYLDERILNEYLLLEQKVDATGKLDSSYIGSVVKYVKNYEKFSAQDMPDWFHLIDKDNYQEEDAVYDFLMPQNIFPTRELIQLKIFSVITKNQVMTEESKMITSVILARTLSHLQKSR